jgi:hypothetical protein
MKYNKFVLTIKTDNGEIKENYNSLRDIANKLNIEYHHARQLQLLNLRPRKFYHPILQQLNEVYKIETAKPELKLYKGEIETKTDVKATEPKIIKTENTPLIQV